MNSATALSRIDRAVIALHDYGTREGATAAKVKRQMKDAGFTPEEIVQAAKKMGATT